ncbi:hypothetical protein HG536_0D02700 [Torulaspora globosa]|uniref:WLM domain-containing protein n=1 Tax=Torulaspora globosa TaxID=48254 RepID=A0A7G3ZGW2_9SACH|nr:uncharacterized protein HG536_0D02700 [Torulaspora globosa]QLL32748.1 hypothetical protein HG536_0D02700 [Torulaspora globosa]
MSTDHKNPHVAKVAVLQKKPNKEDALQLLKHIAHSISYIMKENGFKVGSLVEFYPRDRRLLGMNVNRGMKIMLRLRNPSDEFQFLPRESIMGTALHELTHNVFGPHDNKFYAKLDELTGRQWVIEQRGLYDTFLGQGRRLGGSQRREIELNRRQNSQVIRSRGVRLGSLAGGPSDRTPREMAALAAQRRADDSRWCGEAKQGRVEQPSDEDLEVITIDGEESDGCSIRNGNESIEIIDLT